MRRPLARVPLAGRSRPSGQMARGQSINRLIPNMLTLVALCAGLTAIRFGLEQRFEHAVLAIVVAAALDGLDGRVARLIGATSRFGAELDSLSDFVCFGVSPPILLFLWMTHETPGFGWAVVLLFATCAALRLARFNTAEDEDRPAWRAAFFTGVPTPAGAFLAVLPMAISFELKPNPFDAPLLVGGWALAVAALMVSRLPTFAAKRVRIPNSWVLPTLLSIGLVGAGLATELWLTMAGLGGLYLLSIPLAWRRSRKLRAAAAPPAVLRRVV